ncbi:MAG: glycogen/starch synthase [Muribaculaceae bacterium]|nr:glycogen/starch synthase [Muribaculaceae bacterium]
MEMQKVALDLLFETSWEVCNKIGGIYTVLSTKAKTLQTLYKDKVVFIGPDVWSDENPSPYFVESRTLLKEWKAKAELPCGISVRVGRWDVLGKPIVVLVKFDGVYPHKDEFYGKMWELYGVDSMHAYGDYDEGCAFALASGMVIESIANFYGTSGKNIIAHFDEWTTGMGLLYVRWKLPQVGTVFTTHATSIGRSICSNGKQLYEYFSGYNGDQMARELNMEAKHSLEKAAAHTADCFTTVSEITARECEQLLDIRPHVVTPNGFEPGFVPGPRKIKAARRAAREVMLNVASSLTGIKFADEDTFIVATAGRCEYRNKGLDVFIDSMSRLKELSPAKRILAYIMVPAWSREARADLQAMLSRKRKPGLDDPFITHWLNNPGEDAVNNHMRNVGISNTKDCDITLIYVPCYLNGNDGIFNLSYYDTVVGVDATVFPSYYEPWGYTPLESVAFGVPTVTTSLSGFGSWICAERGNGFAASGVDVVERNDHNYPQVVDAIADDIRELASMDDAACEEIRKVAVATSDAALWQYFMTYYEDSYRIALDAAAQRR